MLESVRIQNFRGISDLAIDGFARINVFVGTNGSGKTSVLEAIGLFANPGNPHFAATLAAWREMPGLNAVFDYPLRSFFRDMDPRNAIKIAGKSDKGSSHLVINAHGGPSSATTTSGSSDSGMAEPGNLNGGVHFTGARWEYQDTKGGVHPVDAALVPQGLQSAQFTFSDVATSFFIHGRRSNSVVETASALTELLQARKESELYRVIRAIDPRVGSLISGLKGGQPVVLADVGGAALLPIQLLGDGFCRACLIATGLVTRGPQTVLVDEIDSGLHFSVMENFWKSIHEMCKSFGVQLFCVTHNEEMLRYALAAFADQPADLKVYRIDRKVNGKIAAQPYDYHLLTVSQEAGIEVR